MTTQVSLGYTLWQDGMTFNGQLGRQLDVAATWQTQGTSSALQVTGGVINSIGALKCSAASGMNITVNAGFAIVPNTTSSLQGGYRVGSLVSNTLTVPTADMVNPRIDIVTIGVSDPGSSAGFGFINIISGIPAPSPVASVAGANSIILYQILVPALASSITSGNLTDVRNYTSVAGGVTLYPTAGASGPGFPSLLAYDAANDRFFHNNAISSEEQMRVLPWTPAYGSSAASFLIPITTPSVVKSLTVTTDGNTDIKMTFGYSGIFQTTTMGLRLITLAFCIDGTAVQSYLVTTRTDAGLAGVAYDGRVFIYHTSSGTGDTPSAGTHTLTVQASYSATVGSGDAPHIEGNATNTIFFRAEPVGL